MGVEGEEGICTLGGSRLEKGLDIRVGFRQNVVLPFLLEEGLVALLRLVLPGLGRRFGFGSFHVFV